MITTLLLAFLAAQDHKIFERIVSDDLDGVRKLIDARPELVRTQDDKGRRPLAWARSKEMIELLISKGADPNARDNEGRTALADMVYTQPAGDMVGTLLRLGADPKATRGGKAGLIRVALGYQAEETALLLLEHEAPFEELPDAPNSLHMAGQLGLTRVVRKLLDLHVKVDVASHHGFTALHLALANGHEAAARMLIAAGADVNLQTPSLAPFIGGINRSYNGLQTPLLLACVRGLTGTARILLDKGAKVDARDQFGSTPLHHAARLGNVDLARLLLEHKAEVDGKDAAGQRMPRLFEPCVAVGSPLHLAAEGGSRTLVELLLQSKPDLRSQDEQGRTALHRLLDPSESSWMPEMLEVMQTGQTLFRREAALMKGDRIETLRVLIQAGADVNAADGSGNRPLKLALKSNDTQAANLLRRGGAKE